MHLRELYGEAAALRLGRAVDGGPPYVELTLPARFDARPSPDARGEPVEHAPGPDPSGGRRRSPVRAAAGRPTGGSWLVTGPHRRLDRWLAAAVAEHGTTGRRVWPSRWRAALLTCGGLALGGAVAVGAWHATGPTIVQRAAALLGLAVIPAALVLAVRAHLGRERTASASPPSLRHHLPFAAGAAALHVALRIVAGARLDAAVPPAMPALGTGGAVAHFVSAVGSYALLAVPVYLALSVRARRRTVDLTLSLRAARGSHERRRVDSELRALKGELNPHFVGNALHTAAALVHAQPEVARRLLGALATLAQEAGARIDLREVALEEELAGLAPFLALEQARLGTSGGELQVEWRIDAEAERALVPHLVLQPLVENAVRHGLAPRGGVGRVTLAARREGERLTLTVRDDGVGPGAAASPTARPTAGGASGRGVGAGHGLSGVRRRLALLYGADATCTLTADPAGGTIVRLELPHRVADPPDTAPAEHAHASSTIPAGELGSG